MTNEKRVQRKGGSESEKGDDALFVGCVLLDLGNGVFDRDLSFGLSLSLIVVVVVGGGVRYFSSQQSALDTCSLLPFHSSALNASLGER
jgi:hypothetical protein